MESESSYSLVLCGKSSAEVETAVRLKNTNALNLQEGMEASVLLQSEAENRFGDHSFNVSLFMDKLSTRQFGRFLIWSPRLPSPKDVIFRNFNQLPLGAVCVADVQILGRDFHGSVWVSPRGGLSYTFTVQMEDARLVSWLQYVVPLAVTEAVKDICIRNGIPCIDLKILWPCDIYLNGLQVGEIFCGSTYRSKKFNITVVVVLNVDTEQPTTCLNAVLKDISPASHPLRREEILAAFFNKFEMLFNRFVHHGFKCLKELYYSTWLHSEQRIIIRERKEDKDFETSVTIQGLTSSGYLLAIGDDDNEIYELKHGGKWKGPSPDTTDMFEGLVRVKL